LGESSNIKNTKNSEMPSSEIVDDKGES